MNRIILRTEAHRDRAARMVGALPIQTPPYVVQVGEYKAKRTLEQNSLIQRLIREIRDWPHGNPLTDALAGLSVDDARHLLCAVYFGDRRVQVGKRVINLPAKTTSQCSVAELTGMIDWLYERAAANGVVLDVEMV